VAPRLNILDQSEAKSSCANKGAVHFASTEQGASIQQFKGRAVVITLGCAKNQVDSEIMLGALSKSGFEIVTDLATADVAIVNTCGFLESAVKESIDSILDVAEYKEKGQLRQLIVAGCMVERYGRDLKETIPEVDSFISTDDLLKVGEVASGAVYDTFARAARPYFLYDETMPRVLSSRSHTAYVKISEGCDRPCTFCIIPRIRGAMRSRSIESLAREVSSLGAQGVREVNLVAQDLTGFGRDTREGNLGLLLRKLDATKAVDWIRLLYAYPIGIEKDLLDAIVELPSVCNYLDFPLQHSSEPLLKAMQRPIGRFSPRRIVEFIRNYSPQILMRTTFIVGFPGETENDIDDLEAFIREGHFLNVGIFTYSQEQGTPAGGMSSQIESSIKEARRERLMLAQQEVVTKRLEGFIGQSVEVLVEGLHEETDLLLTGRTRFQAPEVDGTVIINDIAPGLGEPAVGSMGMARVTEVVGYDLVATLESCEETENQV
jgi:ribosomal protein S12 methylthiotransferase